MFKRKYFLPIWSKIHDEKLILLVGARQVGKTTLLSQIEAWLKWEWHPTVFLSLEDPDILARLDIHPRELFSLIGTGSDRVYLCLDEVQYLRDPSGFLKYHSDLSSARVKIIATGSSAFYIDTRFHDSLAGRKWLYEILPLDFPEWLELIGRGSLIPDLDKIHNTPSYYTLPEILRLYEEYALYGGYPGVAKLSTPGEKKELLRLLVTDYAKKDALEGGIEKPEKYYMLMRLLAHGTGSLMNKNEISETLGLDIRTIERYIWIMERSYHVRRISPFFRNIRKELTKMPKIYWYDTGIRNALMNAYEPMMFRWDSGSLLENLVLEGLSARYPHEDILFWRTQDGEEIDFVLPGVPIAYEVKKNKKKYTPTRHKSFTEVYREIPVVPIDLTGSLMLWGERYEK